MSTDGVPSSVYKWGKIALWVILPLLLATMAYSIAMVVPNWGAIGV